jgi:hypothetical protein
VTNTAAACSATGACRKDSSGRGFARPVASGELILTRGSVRLERIGAAVNVVSAAQELV